MMTLFLFISCSGQNNNENANSFSSEISCSEADGTWHVVSVTCDGVPVFDLPPSTFSFDNQSKQVIQLLGSDTCTKQIQLKFDATQVPLVHFEAEGSLTCLQNSTVVPLCQDGPSHCHSGLDLTGLSNEFPNCVITTEGMSWSRDVSSQNNPNNLSYCQNGETETVLLRKE